MYCGKKVAVTLYKLGSCAEYRVGGAVFGIHISTVKKCVYEVVTAIKHIMPSTIQIPCLDSCVEISDAFEIKSQIPQIIGCIDDSHIPVKAPTTGKKDFINRKTFPLIVLQAVDRIYI